MTVEEESAEPFHRKCADGVDVESYGFCLALHQLESNDRDPNPISLLDEDLSDEYLDEDEFRVLRSRETSSIYKWYGTEDHLRDAADENQFIGMTSPSQMLSLRSLDDQRQASPDSPTTIYVNEWRDVLDYGFLDQLELVPSDDDLEKEGYKISPEDWDEMFFKVFATKLRRSKLVLRTKLPKLRKSGRIRSIFMNDGTKLRNVTYELDKCHRAAKQCFNFQRQSYIICSEGDPRSPLEDFKFRGTTYSFMVEKISAINPLCLWDFNSFWNTEKDFQVASDTSPYLSMMASQWKDALKADRIGRWIMMHDAAAVEFLKGQGETASARAEDLKDIHSFSMVMKLVLSEFISRNKASLKNGMVIKGRDIVRSLCEIEKNERLFSREIDLKEELVMCNFVFNPEDHDSWLEMFNDGINSLPLGFEQRLIRRTIFLCDIVHWTMCLLVLLDEKVKAMEQFMIETVEVKHQMGTTRKTSKITYMRSQVSEEIDGIKKLISLLPSLRDLELYVFKVGTDFIKIRYAEETSFNKGLFGISGLLAHQEQQRSKSRISITQRFSLKWIRDSKRIIFPLDRKD